MDDVGGCLVLAVADLPQRADCLHLLVRRGFGVAPVSGVGRGEGVFVGEAIDEDLDGLAVPGHVEDHFRAVVF